jgi:hypothetical protein
MGAFGAPPHLLPLTHAVIDEVVHDRFDMRCGDTLARSSSSRKVWHRPPIPPDIPRKVADRGFDSLARVATVISTGAQPPDRIKLEPTEVHHGAPWPASPESLPDTIDGFLKRFQGIRTLVGNFQNCRFHPLILSVGTVENAGVATPTEVWCGTTPPPSAID